MTGTGPPGDGGPAEPSATDRPGPDGPALPDRARPARPPLDDPTPLAEVRISDLRRSLITLTILALVLVLFFVMVAEVLLAAVVGTVAAIYMRPLYCWIENRTGRPALSGIVALTIVVVPAVAMVVYGYMEVRGATIYLAENTDEAARRIAESLGDLPYLDAVRPGSIRGGLEEVAEWAAALPVALQAEVGELMVAVATFFFTAFYVLTDAHGIIAWLRGLAPSRYAALTEALEANARGVLHGAIYSTMLTQGIKSLLVLVLNLALGVPLPFTLALLAFIIGFFPVVGAWTIYVPAAGYLLVFQDAPVKALVMLVVGFGVSTVFLSFYLRPKLAADRSHVLNFYWMFLGLVAGVYTFGITGIVVGPLIVGLLKALMDTLTTPDVWERRTPEGRGMARAEIMVKKELEAAEADPEGARRGLVEGSGEGAGR